MDLKTRIEVLPCGKCEEMIGCDKCLFQKEARELYKQIRADAIGEYSNDAHSRICYDLVDIMADLNEKEIKSHDDIDAWLKVWKSEIIRKIWHSMCEARFEKEQLTEKKDDNT